MRRSLDTRSTCLRSTLDALNMTCREAASVAGLMIRWMGVGGKTDRGDGVMRVGGEGGGRPEQKESTEARLRRPGREDEGGRGFSRVKGGQARNGLASWVWEAAGGCDMAFVGVRSLMCVRGLVGVMEHAPHLQRVHPPIGGVGHLAHDAKLSSAHDTVHAQPRERHMHSAAAAATAGAAGAAEARHHAAAAAAARQHLQEVCGRGGARLGPFPQTMAGPSWATRMCADGVGHDWGLSRKQWPV
eukprot:351936-Chlamydomonas_euryale.AAC.1